MWFSLLIAFPLVPAAPAPSFLQEAQDAVPVTATPAEFTPLISLECKGLESMLVDEKDARLREALQMIDDRLLELPTEIPGWEAPPGTLELLLRVLDGPSALTVGLGSEAIANMPMPFAGELRLTKASPDAAQAIAKDVAGFATMMGVPLAEPDANGKWVLPAPIPIWMGSDEDGLVLRLGMESGVTKPDQSHLLPEGVQMSSGGMLNYGKFIDTMMPMIAGQDPAMEELMKATLVGSLDMEWASGTDAERSYTIFNMPGWATIGKAEGLLTEEDLNPAIIAAIPGDATWAFASTMNLQGIIAYYEKVLAMSLQQEGLSLQGLSMEYAGLDLNAEVLGPLGSHIAVYASDTTGGGGMLSTIGLIELSDRDAFLGTWGKLEAALGKLGKEQAMGYVRFSHLDHSGQDLSILSFPGLPVPLELTMTTTDQFAIFGLTPSAVVAAVQQIQGGEGKSLLGNPDFMVQLPGGGRDMAGVHSIDWVNTPRLMRDGYGVVSLMCSALSNAVRSPSNEARSAGLILPPMNTLRAGAKGMLSVGRVVGDDLRAEMRGDRSQLVNATGVTGYMANSPVGPLVLGIVLGSAVMPQVIQAEEQAQRVQRELGRREAELDRVRAELRSNEEEQSQEAARHAEAQTEILAIGFALDVYAAEHEGVYPDQLNDLLGESSSGGKYLEASALIDPWGNEYQYEAPNEEHKLPQVSLAR